MSQRRELWGLLLTLKSRDYESDLLVATYRGGLDLFLSLFFFLFLVMGWQYHRFDLDKDLMEREPFFAWLSGLSWVETYHIFIRCKEEAFVPSFVSNYCTVNVEAECSFGLGHKKGATAQREN